MDKTLEFNEACINCGNELFDDEELNEGYCGACLDEFAEGEKADMEYEYARERENENG